MALNIAPRGFRLQASELAEKVAALSRAETYGEISAEVVAIETHMSWVFLTDRHAYKLKKPVQSEFLNFGSLEWRRHYCEEELRLNLRLAPSVYLGVVTLNRAADGHLCVGGDGVVVDYLVKMVRLPAHKMLDQAIADRSWQSRDVRAIMKTLAAFYARAERVPMAPDTYEDFFVAEIQRNLHVLTEAHYGLPKNLVEEIVAAQLRYVTAPPCPLNARAVAGRIVDAHGDLRPEHIYLGPPVQIIDCLEFRHELRRLDPADEIGFLAMECARLGAPQVGRALLRFYRVLTGDAVAPDVIRFYQSHRACVRAKLAVWHLDDSDVRDPDVWRRRAIAYLGIAYRAICV